MHYYVQPCLSWDLSTICSKLAFILLPVHIAISSYLLHTKWCKSQTFTGHCFQRKFYYEDCYYITAILNNGWQIIWKYGKKIIHHISTFLPEIPVPWWTLVHSCGSSVGCLNESAPLGPKLLFSMQDPLWELLFYHCSFEEWMTNYIYIYNTNCTPFIYHIYLLAWNTSSLIDTCTQLWVKCESATLGPMCTLENRQGGGALFKYV